VERAGSRPERQQRLPILPGWLAASSNVSDGVAAPLGHALAPGRCPTLPLIVLCSTGTDGFKEAVPAGLPESPPKDSITARGLNSSARSTVPTSTAQLWKPTPHAWVVPAATIGSSRASQSGSPLQRPAVPKGGRRAGLGRLGS